MGGVTCIGAAVVDRRLHLHAPPRAGTSNPARMVVGDGGVARNVAESLARLGVPVALVSRVGDDETGRRIVATLTAVGVDTSRIVGVSGRCTAEYVAVLDGSSLVLGVAAMDLLDELDADDVDRGWPADGADGWVFLDCNCPPPVLGRAIARAREGGVRLAVDVVSTPKAVRLPADLHGIAVLFCNADEARALLERTGLSRGSGLELAGRLRAAGAGGVVLTDGAGPVAVAGMDGSWEVPATPARPVDETGAGDALVAGTLAALLTGRPLPAAVATGTVVATLTAESEHTVRPDLSPALVEQAAALRRQR